MTRAVIRMFLILISPAFLAHTFYVTNTKDDGSEGSFRWAVEMCNWYPIAPDTVLFAIPLEDPSYDPELGVWTIHADSSLTGAQTKYQIHEPGAYIDALSQKEYIGHDTNPYGPEIQLVGHNTLGECFDIEKSNVTVRGFCINNYESTAFHINPWPPSEIDIIENIVIAGCYIATDPTGTTTTELIWEGIGVHYGRNIVIGGDNIDDRNIIGLIRDVGIQFDTSGEAFIINNHIGVDPSGTINIAFNDPDHGIKLDSATGPILVQDNLIGGNWGNGLQIQDCSNDVGDLLIYRNIIGEGFNGAAMGPYWDGIELWYSPGVIIKENIIAHVSGWYGIDVRTDYSDYITMTKNSIFDTHRLGIRLHGGPTSGSGMNLIDGQYGPGANEEIDPCFCDSVVNSTIGLEGTTTAYFTCMTNCTVEVFLGDEPGYHPYCPLPNYGDAYSGKTYLGDAEEIIQGPVFSQYRFSISPALPEGTILTTTATNQNGSTSEFGCSCTIPLMGETESGCLPSDFKFFPPSPNPSNGSVTLCYHVPETTHVFVAIYDMAGRQINTITDAVLSPQVYGLKWDGRDRRHMQVPAGTYIVRMVSEGFMQSHTLNIVR